MTRFKTLIVAMVAVAAAAGVSAVPAAAWTHNTSHAYLRFPSRGGTFTVSRTLPHRLHGRYLWAGVAGTDQYLHGRNPRFQRYVTLNGRYRMVDTLKPSGRIYVHNAQIINVRTGGKVNLPTQPVNDGNGMYYWGSLIAH
jgi:hypothetical protein